MNFFEKIDKSLEIHDFSKNSTSNLIFINFINLSLFPSSIYRFAQISSKLYESKEHRAKYNLLIYKTIISTFKYH